MPYWIWIFIGGGMGSVCRFFLAGLVQNKGYLLGSPFPWGILCVNLIGCFLIGVLAGLPNGHLSMSFTLRATLVTGFLGGLTTFSSYAYDSFMLFRNGETEKAVLNLCVSVIGGMGCLLLGFYITKILLSSKAIQP